MQVEGKQEAARGREHLLQDPRAPLLAECPVKDVIFGYVSQQQLSLYSSTVVLNLWMTTFGVGVK